MMVYHKVFGSGNVIEINNGYIDIQFESGNKRFQFPKSFDSFLKTDDASLQLLIDEERAKLKLNIPSDNEKKPIMKSKKPDESNYYRKYTGNSNQLIGERAQTIWFSSDKEMFEIIGYLATPGRISSIEAEVPKDGRHITFERMFPGQTYRPIEMGDTPSGLSNKFSPQFRINFGNLRNCPDILKRNIGKGNASCVGRINKSRFVLTLVQYYGFKFGEYQDVAKIYEIAEKQGYSEAFNRGYYL